jgi:hypothetical protein
MARPWLAIFLLLFAMPWTAASGQAQPAGQRGEVAYAVQSLDSNHGEFKSDGDPADRVVGRRHWVSLQLDF